MKTVFQFILASILFGLVRNQNIVGRINHRAVLTPNDGYWGVKTDGTVNKPNFRAYIKFYNKHDAVVEHLIDCSVSDQVLYYQNEIIFRTNREWSTGSHYYITLDEGVLYSNNIENSTARLSPDFWTFEVRLPRDF